jgi:hypothetical protein
MGKFEMILLNVSDLNFWQDATFIQKYLLE